jgi:hypothetical protein
VAVSNFEQDVIDRLARIEERTTRLDRLEQDVSSIKSRVGLLEFKASLFGAMAGALVLGVKQLVGK